MPVTQHAPPPVVLPRDDKSVPISKTSAPSYPSKPVDVRPIVTHQPSRDSPPAPSAKQPPSRPDTPKPVQPLPRSSPPRDTTPQVEPGPEDEDVIDMETFQQILELDDSEDDREFSREMVLAYFSQAVKTFGELDDALKKKELGTLSALGHFLKGSSAALGVTRVQDACEKIQHYGVLRDEEHDKNLSSEQALSLIQKTLTQLKLDYDVADRWLRNFYGESS